jgi:hypothetical protein
MNRASSKSVQTDLNWALEEENIRQKLLMVAKQLKRDNQLKQAMLFPMEILR